MAHVRQQIRDAMVTRLTGLTTTGSNVFPSRVYPISAAKLPGIAVYTSGEEVEYATITQPRTLIRTLTVSVEVYAKGVADYDDVLDTVCSQVETALYTDVTLGGLAKDASVSSIETEFSGEGDQPLARATIQITVTYATIEGTPDVAV